jgi:hypothetical protein
MTEFVHPPLGKLIHAVNPDKPEATAECGVRTHPNRAGAWPTVDPSNVAPGLRWCPACLGHLAERKGRLSRVISIVVHDAP